MKPLSKRARRVAGALGALAAVAGLVLAARALPVDEAVARLRGWAEEQGALGLVVFGAAYVVGGLALVPGSALTLAAGAVYGVGLGFALVSIASTLTAALAFLLARYLLRARVERLAARRPRFVAVDRAIGRHGWKVVALLRLSPALPFSLSNYLFGLTSLRFGPYVLASWLGMLPGTLLYVMLGDAGAAGLRAASGGAEELDGARVALLVVGLVATVAVTALVTRAARRELAGILNQAENEG